MHDGSRPPTINTQPQPRSSEARVGGTGRRGCNERASPSLEQPARGLDVARDERTDRLFDVWCGQADALGAIVGIRTVAALSRTLSGAFFRKIAQSAFSRTLPHPTGMAF